jgi:CheY-like chemotaxis protein
MRGQLYRILLVEDNPGDVILVEESLHWANVQFELTHCDTVKSAVETIKRYGPGDPAVPDLLLLDYNLPAGESREVLDVAITNPVLVGMRKAVITSSMSPRDRENALRSGAECVISKPAELDLFLAQVGTAIVKLLVPSDTAGQDARLD